MIYLGFLRNRFFIIKPNYYQEHIDPYLKGLAQTGVGLVPHHRNFVREATILGPDSYETFYTLAGHKRC